MIDKHEAERRRWRDMLQRCYNERNRSFKNYGGRGIGVCERWRESFANFYADMGKCGNGMSLDRIDNNAGYSPGNCRWATATDQSRNTRRSTAKDAGLSFDGKLNKWVAYITVKRRTVRIGAFADRNDAIAARRQAEHHYWKLRNEPPPKGSAPRNNRSGHVGVYQDKRHGTWTAYYGGRGRRVHIGSYRSAVEAAAARSEWLRAHGIGGSDAE